MIRQRSQCDRYRHHGDSATDNNLTTGKRIIDVNDINNKHERQHRHRDHWQDRRKYRTSALRVKVG